MERLLEVLAYRVRWVVIVLVGACACAVAACRKTSKNATQRPVLTESMKSSPAADQSLEITLEIRPEVRVDRVPMRSLVLHFRNLTNSPLRLYLPQAPEFRANISTVYMVPEGAPPLGIPEPHPHGYVVTEADFPELAPGQARDFEQPFTIDPFSRTGANTERRAGFEPGRSVRVSWTYENSITRWQGGIATLDGPTRMLFDGGKIPNIWTGKLEVEMRWTIPS